VKHVAGRVRNSTEQQSGGVRAAHADPSARAGGHRPRALAAGEFFGGARLSHAALGIELSHRFAEGDPDSLPEHTHPNAHFIWVTGGAYVSAAQGHPASGQLPLIYNPPGTTHRDHFREGRGSFFAISLPVHLNALIKSFGPTPTLPVFLHAPRQRLLAMRIVSACRRPREDLELEAGCLRLLASLAPQADRTGRPPPWLARALELLQDRYRDALTVADIARAVGVHPIHLARTFHRHLDCGPAQLARLRRLERALQLLSRGGTTLAEVALSSGFADQSHFTRAFSAFFGVPPRRYRMLAGPGGFQIDKTANSPWHTLTASMARVRVRAGRHR
jgi:AraC family transcriptional regulator